MKDATRYLGVESIEEKRARALAEQAEAEEKYETARDVLDSFEAAVRHLVQDDNIQLRRNELRQIRQAAFDTMKEAREVVNFACRCSSAGNKPPRYKATADLGDGSWIKR